jgi:hypothetical protein
MPRAPGWEALAAFGNSDVTADNKFNPQAATFIDAQQPGRAAGSIPIPARRA